MSTRRLSRLERKEVDALSVDIEWLWYAIGESTLDPAVQRLWIELGGKLCACGNFVADADVDILPDGIATATLQPRPQRHDGVCGACASRR